MKHILKLEDGRVEPIKDLMKPAKFCLFMPHLAWRLPAMKLSSKVLLSEC